MFWINISRRQKHVKLPSRQRVISAILLFENELPVCHSLKMVLFNSILSFRSGEKVVKVANFVYADETQVKKKLLRLKLFILGYDVGVPRSLRTRHIQATEFI